MNTVDITIFNTPEFEEVYRLEFNGYFQDFFDREDFEDEEVFIDYCMSEFIENYENFQEKNEVRLSTRLRWNQYDKITELQDLAVSYDANFELKLHKIPAFNEWFYDIDLILEYCDYCYDKKNNFIKDYEKITDNYDIQTNGHYGKEELVPRRPSYPLTFEDGKITI